jgi:hypothetical protein
VVIPDMSGIVVVLGYQKDLYVDIQELFFDDDILKYVDIFRYFKIVTEIPNLQTLDIDPCTTAYSITI